MTTVLLDAPLIREIVADLLCAHPASRRVLDVTTRHTPEGTLVLVSVSFPAELPFGEVAAVTRLIADGVRRRCPDAARVVVEPVACVPPVRAVDPATETIVLASSD